MMLQRCQSATAHSTSATTRDLINRVGYQFNGPDMSGPLPGAAASGVTCGVDSLDAEGSNFTATPYCETVVARSLFMADDLAYRSVGSIDQADLQMPDSFAFTAIGSGSGFGSISFGSRSLAGIGSTSELGYANSIGKDLMASGRFNIGEDVRWTSFAKTFDVVG
ncbi:MAG: hypothetical protein NTV68_01560 [Methanomicrobiales archaeon]|nr:hypothetical protein [Methanomicrobiales archaeon]